MRRKLPWTRGRTTFQSAARVFAAFWIFTCLARGVFADVGRENALKAGYLLNFMKFVEWPSPEPQTFAVCFFGKSGVFDELSVALPEKRVAGHPLVARTLAKGEPFGDCQVLYVDAAHAPTARAAIKDVAPGVLTVSDAHEFLHIGGVIELFPEGNRLRFRISLSNAQRARLRISSTLLQLASSVETEN